MLKDFCDGCVSKDHSLFSAQKWFANPLLYIEVVKNPGSHKKVHKLGRWCM